MPRAAPARSHPPGAGRAARSAEPPPRRADARRPDGAALTWSDLLQPLFGHPPSGETGEPDGRAARNGAAHGAYRPGWSRGRTSSLFTQVIDGLAADGLRLVMGRDPGGDARGRAAAAARAATATAGGDVVVDVTL